MLTSDRFPCDAHFLMLSPSMFGMLLTAIPYMMPVHEVVMLRVSSSGLLPGSSCSGGEGSSIPVFVLVIFCFFWCFVCGVFICSKLSELVPYWF